MKPYRGTLLMTKRLPLGTYSSIIKSSFHAFCNGIQRLDVRLSLVNNPGIGAFASEMKEKLQGRSKGDV